VAKPSIKKPAGRKSNAVKAAEAQAQRPLRRLFHWAGRGILGLAAFILFMILFYALINPPTTPYMVSEGIRLGGNRHEWTNLEDMAPVMARSVVAAEDANFCNHWGFDMAAIRVALDEGSGRGASTISQQVTKNAFLWQGRSWVRKALEAVMTPVVELVWTKRRIIEVYLNVVEFGEGVFGVSAAADYYFGVLPAELTPTQAARLAAILPSPKTRSASDPSRQVRQRAASIIDGAATIDVDGRAVCFQG
jgi:monofunctional glycosyltransferase